MPEPLRLPPRVAAFRGVLGRPEQPEPAQPARSRRTGPNRVDLELSDSDWTNPVVPGSCMVARDRIELSTFRFSGGRSYRLSYLAVLTPGVASGPAECSAAGEGAVLTGFEPATSALTGRRALQTALQDLIADRWPCGTESRRQSTRSGEERASPCPPGHKVDLSMGRYLRAWLSRCRRRPRACPPRSTRHEPW